MQPPQKPVVYLFHGEDDYVISLEVMKLRERFGDPGLAALNTSVFDGRKLPMDQLRNAALAAPFLADRRIVIIEQVTGALRARADQEAFTALLEGIPTTTALIIQEYALLKDNYWLMKWALSSPGFVYIKAMGRLKGDSFAEWIIRYARSKNGEFTREAARLLASEIEAGGNSDTRVAAQEIEKCLAYAGYTRPVEAEDVAHLTSIVKQAEIFDLVDAVGMRDGSKALRLLHLLLDQGDPISIFAMICRQFRLLLLASDHLDRGGKTTDLAKVLGSHPFVASKISQQCRNYAYKDLRVIYHSLLDIDERIKTGRVGAETALDTLIATLAGDPR